MIVAILTDGQENSSRRYSSSRIAEMIHHQQEVYAWKFVFLAAGQDAIASASQLSIAAEDAIGFDASPQGVGGAYVALSAAVTNRRQRV